MLTIADEFPKLYNVYSRLSLILFRSRQYVSSVMCSMHALVKSSLTAPPSPMGSRTSSLKTARISMKHGVVIVSSEHKAKKHRNCLRCFLLEEIYFFFSE